MFAVYYVYEFHLRREHWILSLLVVLGLQEVELLLDPLDRLDDVQL